MSPCSVSHVYGCKAVISNASLSFFYCRCLPAVTMESAQQMECGLSCVTKLFCRRQEKSVYVVHSVCSFRLPETWLDRHTGNASGLAMRFVELTVRL